MEPKKYRMMMDQLTRPGKPKPKVNKTNTLDNISKRIEEAVDLYEDQPVPQIVVLVDQDKTHFESTR